MQARHRSEYVCDSQNRDLSIADKNIHSMLFQDVGCGKEQYLDPYMDLIILKR